jgi:hypothetical protein
MYLPKIQPDFVDLAFCTVQISTCTDQKLSCYALVVSSILISYSPNINLRIPKFLLNLFEKSSCTVKKFRLILLNCYLVLSYNSSCTVRKASSTDPILTCLYPNFNFFVKKVIMYCPRILPDFV